MQRFWGRQSAMPSNWATVSLKLFGKFFIPRIQSWSWLILNFAVKWKRNFQIKPYLENLRESARLTPSRNRDSRPHIKLTIHPTMLDQIFWSSKLKTYVCLINFCSSVKWMSISLSSLRHSRNSRRRFSYLKFM